MFVPTSFIYVTKIIVKIWVSVNSIGKFSDNYIRGVQFSSTLKID